MDGCRSCGPGRVGRDICMQSYAPRCIPAVSDQRPSVCGGEKQRTGSRQKGPCRVAQRSNVDSAYLGAYPSTGSPATANASDECLSEGFVVAVLHCDIMLLHGSTPSLSNFLVVPWSQQPEPDAGWQAIGQSNGFPGRQNPSGEEYRRMEEGTSEEMSPAVGGDVEAWAISHTQWLRKAPL